MTITTKSGAKSLNSNLTPADVVQTLSRIGKDIDDATEDLAEADKKSMLARRDSEKSYARSFLTTEGAMEIRRYTARLASDDESFALACAEQEQRVIVSKIRALRDRLEIGRSISAIMRMEWSNQ